MSKVADRLDRVEKKVSELLTEREADQRHSDLFTLESTMGSDYWLEALSPEQLEQLIDRVIKPANEWLLAKMGLHVQIVTYQTVEHR